MTRPDSASAQPAQAGFEMLEFAYDAVEADFDQLVLERSQTVPVVLDIGAEWCSPCRVMGPMLERLAKQYQGKFMLAKVDADENMRIAGRHHVKGFPTIIGYSHGVAIDRFHGAQTESFVRRFIENLAKRHASERAGATLRSGSTLLA